MIALIRHAEALGAEGRFIGRTDLPLSALGRDQASALAQALDGARIATLAASPLARARDTAAPLAQRLGLHPVIVPGLAELDMGSWEGRLRAEVKAGEPEAYARRGEDFGRFRPPGGETFAELADRAMAALGELSRLPGPVAAVAHAGVIRVLVCAILGAPLSRLFRLTPDHTRLTVLIPATVGWRVAAFNAPASPELFHP